MNDVVVIYARSTNRKTAEIGLELTEITVPAWYRQKSTRSITGGDMNRGQVYASRKNFIENGVGELMSAKRDFDSIKYARSAVTDREYVRVSDIFGKAVTVEITGDDLEKVLSDMCRIILIDEENVSVPSGVVTDKDTLRQVAALFN